jgi:hypothetical protein
MQNDGSMFGDDGTEMKFDVLRKPPDGKRGRRLGPDVSILEKKEESVGP